MKTTLGERVRLALEGPPKHTQVALAKACGVHPVSVNDWVHDRTQRVEGVHLLAASTFLNVNPRWLADGVGPMRTEEAASTSFVSTGDFGNRSADSVRSMIGQLVAIALPQRPTLRKNLANLLVELVEHPEDSALAEQTISDIERFYKS